MLRLSGTRRRVETLAFSPDGRLLATSLFDGLVTSLWDARTGAKVGALAAAARASRSPPTAGRSSWSP